MIATDSSLTAIYSDAALFLILSRSLLAPFKPLTNAFIAQLTLSIAEKIDHRVEHIMIICDEETKIENAYNSKSSIKSLSITINIPTPTYKTAVR
jgi:hypothetical protein